jgi:hypothetical protein
MVTFEVKAPGPLLLVAGQQVETFIDPMFRQA